MGPLALIHTGRLNTSKYCLPYGPTKKSTIHSENQGALSQRTPKVQPGGREAGRGAKTNPADSPYQQNTNYKKKQSNLR
jgi:hypothetical protein